MAAAIPSITVSTSSARCRSCSSFSCNSAFALAHSRPCRRSRIRVRRIFFAHEADDQAAGQEDQQPAEGRRSPKPICPGVESKRSSIHSHEATVASSPGPSPPNAAAPTQAR